MMLMQVGFLPAFLDIYIGHWILRNIDMFSRDFVYTSIALVTIVFWFACSMNFVENGLSRIEAILLLNAAAVLALGYFLYNYLIVYDLVYVEWTVVSWGGITVETGSIWWQNIDHMHFYEHISRLFIRFMPWIPTVNLLPIFVSFGLLLTVSIAGAKFGEFRKGKRH